MNKLLRYSWISLLLTVAFTFFALPVFAATPVYIDDISADAGATVSVPVMITGAPSIGSFDVVITYDSAVLGSPSVSDGTLTTGVASGTGTSGQVSLAYASTSGFSGTGSIAVIDFAVVGSVGDTSNLAFTTATATEPMFSPVTLTTTDAVFTVSGTSAGTPVYIDDISADAGATVSVPVMITGAPSIGSFDVVITYDSAVLGSPSVSDGTLTTGVASGTGTSGQVSLAYASTSGFSGTGSIAVIDFAVVGSVGDTSNLAFTTATATEPMFSPVTLSTTDAVFTVSDTSTESLSIGSATAPMNSTVTIPVSVANVTDVTGISFDLFYNSSVVTVESVIANSSFAGSSITPIIDNVNGITRIVLTNYNLISASAETPVIDIAFNITGGFGSFTSLDLQNVEFSDSEFNPYTPVVVDGMITVGIKGDFNNNGRVDIGDVAKVAFMVAGEVPEDMNADFNANGRVDIGDAAKIAFYLAGKLSEL